MCILTGPENCYRKEKILSAIVKYSRQIIETFSDSGRDPGTEVRVYLPGDWKQDNTTYSRNDIH